MGCRRSARLAAMTHDAGDARWLRWVFTTPYSGTGHSGATGPLFAGLFNRPNGSATSFPKPARSNGTRASRRIAVNRVAIGGHFMTAHAHTFGPMLEALRIQRDAYTTSGGEGAKQRLSDQEEMLRAAKRGRPKTTAARMAPKAQRREPSQMSFEVDGFFSPEIDRFREAVRACAAPRLATAPASCRASRHGSARAPTRPGSLA
jgi:hypothetical protein